MSAEQKKTRRVEITTKAVFESTESDIKNARYLFAYYIDITNHDIETIQLISRTWVITDADQKIQRIQGKGVIGQQPHISPGDTFSYNSAVILETPVGVLEGAYTFQTDNQEQFDVTVPIITLAQPNSLH